MPCSALVWHACSLSTRYSTQAVWVASFLCLAYAVAYSIFMIVFRDCASLQEDESPFLRKTRACLQYIDSQIVCHQVWAAIDVAQCGTGLKIPGHGVRNRVQFLNVQFHSKPKSLYTKPTPILSSKCPAWGVQSFNTCLVDSRPI